MRFLVCLLATLCALPAGAQTLAELTRTYLDSKTTRNKQAVLDYAEAHRQDYTGSLAQLVVGAAIANSDRGWEEGASLLAAAAPQLVRLKDYVGYYSALALYEQHKDAEAVRALDPVINGKPVSSLRPDAVMLAATIYYENDQADQAVALIETYQPELPAARALGLLADAQVKLGKLEEAAANYQKVYYQYPTATEAAAAATQLTRLRRSLGKKYPPETAAMMFARVDKLITAGQHETARQELQDMTVELAGADRDRARVWLGKARYIRHDDAVAYRWLSTLKVSDPNAEAERLYWLLEAARRLGRRGTVTTALTRLEKNYKGSGWRMQALISAGNMYLVENRYDDYLPLYQACADDFASMPDAAYCQWKVAWIRYIRRLPVARDLFRKHISTFPSSEHVPAALYFLGRLAEKDADQAAAKAWYQEIVSRFPSHYYTELAEERLRWEPIAKAAASPRVEDFLRAIRFPEQKRSLSFDETAASEYRIARAQLLTTAGLYEWAEKDLYFAARTEGNGPVLAMELARLATRREDYGKSIRYMKALAPNYLRVPYEAAPDVFWRLTFPLPYREEMEKYASRQNIDLYLLAAMIRQESEFDARAKSRAGALGLIQVLPGTARRLYRRLGYRRYSASMLYDPETNLNIGTHIFRTLVDDLDGHTEAALASYNAGQSRAAQWLTWSDFREPAEFVETIPFTETRNYVRAVLRNAYLYRRIYGQQPASP